MRVAAENPAHFTECARVIKVVGIEPREDLAGSHRPAFGNGIALAPIGLTGPVAQAITVPLQDAEGVIGAARVEDDILEVRIILGKDGGDRTFKELSLVVGRRYNCNSRPDAGEMAGLPWPLKIANH